MKKISKLVTAVLVASLISGCGKETPAVEETAENVAVSEETEETTEETVPDDVEEAGDAVEETSVEGYAFSFNDDFYFNIPEGWYINKWYDFGDEISLNIFNPSKPYDITDITTEECEHYDVYIGTRTEIEDWHEFRFDENIPNSDFVVNMEYPIYEIEDSYSEKYKSAFILYSSNTPEEYAIGVRFEKDCPESDINSIKEVFEAMLQPKKDVESFEVALPQMQVNNIIIDDNYEYKFPDKYFEKNGDEEPVFFGISPSSKYNCVFNDEYEGLQFGECLNCTYTTFDLSAYEDSEKKGETYKYETEQYLFFPDYFLNYYDTAEKYFFSNSKQFALPYTISRSASMEYFKLNSIKEVDTADTVYGEIKIFYAEEDLETNNSSYGKYYYDTEVAIINNNGHNMMIVMRYATDEHYEASGGRREGYQGRLKAFFEESGLLAE